MASDEITRLVAGVTITEAIEMIAQMACANTHDMMTDFIVDPSYIKTEGLPTKEHFADVALDQALCLMQDQCAEEFDRIDLPRLPDEPMICWNIRKAIKLRLSKDPSLLVLEYKVR